MTDPVFFAPARRFTVDEIATVTGAKLVDGAHGSIEISALATASQGSEGHLIFVEKKGFEEQVRATGASAVLCRAEQAEHVPATVAALVTDHPKIAFAAVGRLLFPSAAMPGPLTGETGVSPAAHVDPEAAIEQGAIVEAGAVIGKGAAVGSGTIIGPGAVIGPQCQIGRDSYVAPNATVICSLIGDRVIIHAGARIGQDGFGYVPGQRGPDKVPQLGRVIIQDDVEVGANTTIDRGAIGDTVIGQASKIDNLVQIAHNVQIGRCCLIAAHTGISGSATLGDFVALGGRVGIIDHVSIGTGAQIAAGSGLMNDVPPGEKWAGAPAQPYRVHFREVKAVRDLGQRKQKGGE